MMFLGKTESQARIDRPSFFINNNFIDFQAGERHEAFAEQADINGDRWCHLLLNRGPSGFLYPAPINIPDRRTDIGHPCGSWWKGEG